MSLREPTSAADVAARRDRILAEAEDRLADAAGAALRDLLRAARAHLTPDALTAAVDQPASYYLFTLGQAHDWWTSAIDRHLAARIRQTWRGGFFDTSDRVPAREASADYFTAVRDRLSRTATPTIPDQAFDIARTALSDELANGRSIREASQRLAAEFSWDQPAGFWRDRLADLDAQIDAILDRVGPPGSPAREAARLGDPDVMRLQGLRAQARKGIDRVESTWQTRATRIARTEATGAYNSGALEALVTEEAGVKRWVASADSRTRDSHLWADGQCVPVQDTFTVGGAAMMMPGDPSAPVGEVVNCRCTIVGARDCDDAEESFGAVDRVIGRERDRRAGEIQPA